MKFRISLERDEDSVWIAERPSIPGCDRQGDTKGEAMAQSSGRLKVRQEHRLLLMIGE